MHLSSQMADLQWTIPALLQMLMLTVKVMRTDQITDLKSKPHFSFCIQFIF